jgi:hypothetical protein
MGKSTISMAIFNSYVKLPEGIHLQNFGDFSPSGDGMAYCWVYHIDPSRM